MSSQCDELCEEVKRVSGAVFGNGKPEESLIVRLCNVEKRLAFMLRLLWITLSGVWLVLFKVFGSWIDGIMRGS
ncbi:MAG: hypothetical protein JXO22_02880 [Phycisphaerae bacterium]|nr:hypothetical protein [Phycisphaerae bacterium]